jgi:hypothetical protein
MVDQIVVSDHQSSIGDVDRIASIKVERSASRGSPSGAVRRREREKKESERN